jgi:hypothetical protein
MRVTRLALTLGLTTLASLAIALPPMVKDFETAYGIKKGSNLNKLGCAVCHIGKTTKLNPYGLDMKKELEAAKTKQPSPEIFKSLEEMDSDKDGVKNLAEIKADTNPGDAKSKPKK